MMNTGSDERAQWLALRSTGIGASEAAIIIGLSKWKSPYALWAEKCGLAGPDDEETERQKWGLILEPVIAAEYTAQTGRELIDHGRYDLRRSESCPIMTCTLDREIVAIDDRGSGCLEIKTTSAYGADDWMDEPPLHYQIQVQHQMAVTGWRWGSMAVLIGGQQFRWCDVERNDEFIDLLTRKCIEFWKLVETRTPPPIDASDSTSKALRKMFEKDEVEAVGLPGAAIEWDEQIKIANEEIARATERKKEAQNKLIAAIGNASYGVLSDGSGRWSFKNQVRKAHQVAESTTRVLRRTK